MSKNVVFLGKRHDNKILEVQILFSRNFVVIAQAPIKIGVSITNDLRESIRANRVV